MSVIAALSKEHLVFRTLIDRLERSLGYDEQTARAEVRDTLLVLLPALDIHEEIEEAVFGHPTYASKEDAKYLLGETEHQHRQIQELRARLIDALGGGSQDSLKHLKSFVAELVQKLRLHFETEEKKLWPHYQIYSRSLDASIKRRLEEKVKDLRKNVEKHRLAVADYLNIRR